MSTAPRRSGRASALVLLGVLACVLANALFPWLPLRMGGRVLLVAFVALEWRRMALNAQVMVGIAVAMTAVFASALGDPARAVAVSLDTGAFLATFFTNQFFLREAARTSPLVHRCSTFFVNQTPARRYALLTLGGYLFGIILNLGVLSLLGIMITKRNSLAAAGGHLAVQEARERRMVLALLRGFSVTPLASPLSISLAVLLTAMPELHWTTMLPLGLATGALLMIAGWLQDLIAAPRHLAHLAPPIAAERDLAALAGVAGLVLLVFFLAVGIENALDIPLSRAILVSLPLVGFGWLAIQYAEYGAVVGTRLVGRRIVRQAAATFPNYRTEIAILASAGFIGTLFAAAIPPQVIAQAIAANPLPPLLLPPLALLLVIIPGLLGINPIVSVTIMASAIHGTTHLPVPVEALALALMAGWALSINSSSLTASAMLMAELVRRPARTVVLGWNGPFSAAAVLLVGGWLAAVSVLMR